MIIMINGAFGVGKTSVANELIKAIPNSMIFDPEEVGFMLRNIINKDIKVPEEDTDDFQDMELWRILTVETAKNLKGKYGRNLIVPMTLYNIEYFKYIKSGFESIDSSTYHYCLMASKDTIHKRLKARGDLEGSWAFLQTEKCLNSFERNDFGVYIDIGMLTLHDVVQDIVTSIKLMR